jgi:hypothetical protein
MGFYPLGAGPLGTLEAIPVGVPAFTRFLDDAGGQLFWLVELDVYQPASGALAYAYGLGTAPLGCLTLDPFTVEDSRTLRFSDRGYASKATDAVGELDYLPYVREAMTADRKVNLEPTRPQVGAAWGAIVLENPDGYWVPLLEASNSDGRAVRVLVGVKSYDADRGLFVDPPFAELREVFRGVAGPWRLGADGLEVPIRDASYLLEKPWQASLYGGTGGADGTSELAGRPKPKCRGEVYNISPVLIDPTNWVYQYNDGPGEVLALYERALANGFSFTADYASYAALVAAGLVGGDYATCDAEGLVRLAPSGGTPAGQITLDARGHFPSGYISNVVSIAYQVMAEDIGIDASFLDQASFTGLAAACPYVGGIYETEPRLAVDVVGYLVGSVAGGVTTSRTGRLRAFRLAVPSGIPAATYDAAHIVSATPRPLEATLSPPNYRRRVGYKRNHTIQTSDLSTDTSVAARLAFLKDEYRWAAWASNTVLTQYRNPTDPPPLASALRDQADAQAVADHLGALWGARRRLYDLEMWLHPFEREIGDMVTISFPDGELADGALGVIVGEAVRSSSSTITVPVLF